ncbi:serine hydrolase domain-containing protein [Nonomuraea turkmeniaca]|uniref:serine hydrolase domain-containing protein n=1 Tax=Nonomuraea turkmeniaca TaxID=103838 RepID=UPI0014777F4B|nr:serine hydrolase domain-containing protein [Nonomuraea turkmeniaca]
MHHQHVLARLTKTVTIRHLLSHTSGIDGDLFLDTGRGDDCVAKYVEACAGLTQNHPLGATQSYCNSGFVIAGRVLERLTGKRWDDVLRDGIAEPLGLTHTWTLPEDVLRFRAAMGHREGGEPAPQWGLMRATGPAGLICARPADVEAVGDRLDPRRVGRPPRPVPRRQHHRPARHALGRPRHRHRRLRDRERRTGERLRPRPGQGAVRRARRPDRAPSAQPADVDAGRYAGVYERAGVRLTVSIRDGEPWLRYEATGPVAALLQQEPQESRLVSVDDVTFLCRMGGSPDWTAAVFYELPDGSPYVHLGARATPKLRD